MVCSVSHMQIPQRYWRSMELPRLIHLGLMQLNCTLILFSPKTPLLKGVVQSINATARKRVLRTSVFNILCMHYSIYYFLQLIFLDYKLILKINFYCYLQTGKTTSATKTAVSCEYNNENQLNRIKNVVNITRQNKD